MGLIDLILRKLVTKSLHVLTSLSEKKKAAGAAFLKKKRAKPVKLALPPQFLLQPPTD